MLGELVTLPRDVPAAIQRLLRGETIDEHGLEAHVFVRATPKGVLSQRVSADVARVLALIDGRRTLTELESQAPGLGVALHSLRDAGLVGLPTALEPTSTP